MTELTTWLDEAVAKATEIQHSMVLNEDRIAVRTITSDGYTHWFATGYGFTAMAVTTAGVELTARTVRENYRTGIELVDPNGGVVASDFGHW